MAGEAPSLAGHAALDLVGGIRGEVRESAVLEVAPEELHGIEIRCVRRKPDDAAARMMIQPVPHERVFMRAAAIPQKDEGAADVAGELA